jgi:hypothetical protein
MTTKEMLSGRRPKTYDEVLHLRQRYFCPQQYHVLQPDQASCAGTYYVFYSFAVDDLPRNSSVPRWLGNPEGNCVNWCGDVFIVKVAPQEKDEHGWAVYENLSKQFLYLLYEGPKESLPVSDEST